MIFIPYGLSYKVLELARFSETLKLLKLSLFGELLDLFPFFFLFMQ